MKKIFKLLCILLISSIAVSAHSSEITKEDLEVFLEQSRAQFGDPINTNFVDQEQLLFDLAKKYKEPVKTLSKFSSALDIDINLGTDYARLIIDSVKFKSGCQWGNGTYQKDLPCELEQNKNLLHQISTTGFKDSTGSLLATVYRNISFYMDANTRYENKNINFFERLISKTPTYEKIKLAEFDFSKYHKYIIDLVEKYGPKPSYLAILLNETHRYLSIANFDKISLGYHLSSIDSEIYLPQFARLQFKAWQLSYLIRAGLTKDANDLYFALPPSKNLMLWNILKGKNGLAFPYSRIPIDLFVELTASLLIENLDADARKLFEIIDEETQNKFSLRGKQKYQFLKEFLKPKLDPNQIYQVFIDGFTEGVTKPNLSEEKERHNPHLNGKSGWLWTLRNGGPTFQQLGHAYLLEHNYPILANYIIKDKNFKIIYGSHVSKDLIKVLGEPYQIKVKEIQSKIGEVERLVANKLIKLGTKSPLKIHLSERPVLFKEKEFPKKTKTKIDKRLRLGSGRTFEMPKGLKKIPVSKYQAVRVEKHKGEWILIYTSHSLDPVGEVSSGGYWVTKSSDDGETWSPGLYLAIQQYYPYVVLSESKIPLISGGKLTLEVAIRELDENSITFPPVHMQAKRSEDGLYLEFDWKDIEKDSDGDQLTDAVEMRMALNPFNKDTDNDGFIDGEDSIPHLPYEKGNETNNEIALNILINIFSYERSALVPGLSERPDPKKPEADLATLIKSAGLRRPGFTPLDNEHTLFLEADPSIFSGLHLPHRLVLYTDKEAKAMRKQYGQFYPAYIDGFLANKDKTKIYVIWSAGWTGGELKLTKTEKGYEVEVTSSWIT